MSFEAGALQISVDVGDDPAALDALLTHVVQVAGGQAGMLTIAQHTTSYGVQPESSELLTNLMQAAAREVSEGGAPAGDTLGQLETAAGRPLAVPVKSQGRSIGLMCLWGGEQPGLAPGMYHLHIDKVEIGIDNARLLERLLNERRWLEAVVQHSSDGVVIVDELGRVVGYNLAMAGLSGWALGEGVGSPCHEMFPLTLDLPEQSTALLPTSTQRFFHTSSPVEARLECRDRTWVEVEVSGNPLWDRKGQPLGWVMTVRDISRRKEKERLQKLFLSAVSHELHTPIAIIRGFAGLIADPAVELDLATIRDKAGIIVSESERLEKMVGQMLYATRIQAGGVQLEREACDVVSLIKQTAKKLEPVLKGAGCQVVLDLDELPHVQADAEKLQQVLLNLVENACKYAKKAPIRISARMLNEHEVVVAVSDAGPGIPQREREAIFTPFERGGDPLKSKVRGVGLGLFISKSIVEAHGGRIGVEEGENGGARFFFTLPL